MRGRVGRHRPHQQVAQPRDTQERLSTAQRPSHLPTPPWPTCTSRAVSVARLLRRARLPASSASCSKQSVIMLCMTCLEGSAQGGGKERGEVSSLLRSPRLGRTAGAKAVQARCLAVCRVHAELACLWSICAALQATKLASSLTSMALEEMARLGCTCRGKRGGQGCHAASSWPPAQAQLKAGMQAASDCTSTRCYCRPAILTCCSTR